jgi:type I restriction enzyme S subunit
MIRSDPALFDSRYLFRLFCSKLLNCQFKVEANGVTRFGLPTAAIDNAILLRPPLEEQKAIAAFIDGQTSRIDKMITALGGTTDEESALPDSFIGLLLEYRSAVITNAVTGAIDVRRAASMEAANDPSAQTYRSAV